MSKKYFSHFYLFIRRDSTTANFSSRFSKVSSRSASASSSSVISEDFSGDSLSDDDDEDEDLHNNKNRFVTKNDLTPKEFDVPELAGIIDGPITIGSTRKKPVDKSCSNSAKAIKEKNR